MVGFKVFGELNNIGKCWENGLWMGALTIFLSKLNSFESLRFVEFQTELQFRINVDKEENLFKSAFNFR